MSNKAFQTITYIGRCNAVYGPPQTESTLVVVSAISLIIDAVTDMEKHTSNLSPVQIRTTTASTEVVL